MGLEDIADIRAIPNITILSPADATELVKMMYALMDYDKPVYLRLSERQIYQSSIKRTIRLKLEKPSALQKERTLGSLPPE